MQTSDDLDHLLKRGNQTGGANKAILDAVNEAVQSSQVEWLRALEDHSVR